MKTISKAMLLSILVFILASCNSFTPQQTETPTPTNTSLPNSTPFPTRSNTTTVTPFPLQTLGPSSTITQIGNSKGVLLGVCSWPNCNNKKILLLDLEQDIFSQIGDDGNRLQDVSPDGNLILLSSTNKLYVMNFEDRSMILVSDNFDGESELGAYWITNNEIIFIKDLGKSKAVIKINKYGHEEETIFKNNKILQLQRSRSTQVIYWIEEEPSLIKIYHWISIDGKEEGHPFGWLSPSGNYSYLITNSSQLEIFDIHDIFLPKTMGTYNAISAIFASPNLFFSSDESKILLQEAMCTPLCSQPAHYIISNTGELISELPEDIGFIWSFGAWSPDDRLFIFNQKIGEQNRSTFNLRILDMNTFKIRTVNNYNNNNVIYEILWVPTNDKN